MGTFFGLVLKDVLFDDDVRKGMEIIEFWNTFLDNLIGFFCFTLRFGEHSI